MKKYIGYFLNHVMIKISVLKIKSDRSIQSVQLMTFLIQFNLVNDLTIESTMNRLN